MLVRQCIDVLIGAVDQDVVIHLLHGQFRFLCSDIYVCHVGDASVFGSCGGIVLAGIHVDQQPVHVGTHDVCFGRDGCFFSFRAFHVVYLVEEYVHVVDVAIRSGIVGICRRQRGAVDILVIEEHGVFDGVLLFIGVYHVGRVTVSLVTHDTERGNGRVQSPVLVEQEFEVGECVERGLPFGREIQSVIAGCCGECQQCA